MEAKEQNALELINVRFAQIQKKKDGERKRKRIHRSVLLLFLAGILISLVLWFCLPVWMDKHSSTGAAGSAKRASVTEKYKDVLTPQEIEEWNGTRVQSGKVYLKLKTEIKITGGTKAYIRLINPPYCAYDCRVSIVEKETGMMLYESDRIEPGTVLKYVGLNRSAEYGRTPVSVSWEFYRHDGDRIIGTEETEAVLLTSK